MPPACPHCGRSDPPEHVGKSSYGWSFSFQTGEGMPRSWAEWKQRLAGERIEDEYGSTVSLSDLETIVEETRGGRNHAREYPRGSYLDAEGHSFSEDEFS